MLPPLRRPRDFALALTFALVLAAPPLRAAPQASGRALEAAILDVLARHGFTVVRRGAAGPRAPGRLAWRDVGETTTHGAQGRIDFVLRAPAFERPLWVEALRPRTRGSLDERLAGLLRHAAVASPDVRVMLVLDGDGRRPEALARARGRVARIRARPVHVMTLAGFRDWLGRRLDEDAAARSRLPAPAAPFAADAPPGSGYLADTVRE